MKNLNLIQLNILLVAQLIPGIGRADPLDAWTFRHGSPTQIPLYSVAYGNGMFVAVGDGIITSPDGVTWTLRKSDASASLAAVAYGNGEFVAIAPLDWGGTSILTSMDGVNWSSRTLQTQMPVSLSAITFGGGQFAGVGNSAIVVSSDGVNWIQSQAGVPSAAYPDSIAFGGGEFVVGASQFDLATGEWVGETILTSPDGLNWIENQSRIQMRFVVRNPWPTVNAFTGAALAYGDGKFAAVAYGDRAGQSFVLTSADGVNWGEVPMPFEINTIAYGGGEFVAFGDGGTIWTSTNAVNWVERRSFGATAGLNAVAYGNGQFVAVGGAGYILTSTDGTNWIERQSDMYGSLTVTYGKGEFVAGVSRVAFGPTGSFQTNFIMTSADLSSWSERSALLPDAHFLDYLGLSFAGGAFFANASDINGGHIFYSTNGVTWSFGTGLFWGYLGRPVYGDGQFVALGGYPTDTSTTPPLPSRLVVMTSAYGLSWGRVDLGTHDSLGPVAYGSGRFVALGGYGTNWVSADGTNWTRHLSGTGASLDAIAFGGGQFVAVGDGVLTSPDGANWLQRESNQDFHLIDITYGAGQFVAVGTSGSILTSSDGINWKRRSSGTDRNFSGVVYGRGHFLAIGDYGAILESDNLLMLNVIPGITNGEIKISLTGPPGLACTIQSSADLISWRNATNITTTQAGTAAFDAQARGSNAQFYRAYSQ